MKTRSFAIDLFLLISILFSASCAAPMPAPTSTPPVTQTSFPTATQTVAPTATPTESSLPAEFKDLQDRLGETAKLYDTGEKDTAGKAIMGMKDKDGNIIESVKSYADGTTSFTYDNTDLTIASIVVEKSSDGELAQLGPWHIENGKIIIDTAPAPKTVEDAKKFPKLAYLVGHAKEKEIDLTIHKYVSMATAETAKNEYQDQDLIDPYFPDSWQSWTYTFEGMKLTRIDDAGLIALRSGYATLMVFDDSNQQSMDLVIIPILDRDIDGSFSLHWELP